MDVLLQTIKNTMFNKSSLTEDFFTAVLQKLISLGYVPKETDAWVLCFAMQSVENSIKNSCNVTSLPEGLFNVAVDKVCGEFLFNMKQSGQLHIDDLDFSGAITSISEGDTSVSFDTGSTDEEKFNQILNFLMHSRDGELTCYRRLKW
jgi:hypothetical protein